jgi:hypothetical protein
MIYLTLVNTSVYLTRNYLTLVKHLSLPHKELLNLGEVPQFTSQRTT